MTFPKTISGWKIERYRFWDVQTQTDDYAFFLYEPDDFTRLAPFKVFSSKDERTAFRQARKYALEHPRRYGF